MERSLAGVASLADLSNLQLPLAEGTQAATLPNSCDNGRPIVFTGDIPVGFERSLGAGRVISLYFDLARQIQHDPARWGYALAALLPNATSRPSPLKATSVFKV